MEAQYIYQLISLILLIFVAVFAFLIPSVREKRTLRKSMDMLRAGDQVLTQNGLKGQVTEIKENTIIISVGPEHTKLEIAKWGVKEVDRGNGR